VALAALAVLLTPGLTRAQGPGGPPTVIEYYLTDLVGSARVVADPSGAVLRRHDYVPFGGEPIAGCGSLQDPQLFTGAPRDRETCLDYFGARYYASNTGRFNGVDPGHVAGDTFNPQTWNAYAYALNNPFRFVDPFGMEPCSITLTGADATAAGVESGGTVQGDCVLGRKESFSERVSRNVFGLVDAFLFTTPVQAPGLGQADQPLADRSPDTAVTLAATVIPFVSKRVIGEFAAGQLESHFAKHAAEWGAGNVTKTAYLKRAQSLLSRAPGGDILGHVRANGDVLRYNVRTNEFVVGTAQGQIRTLFRPADGLQYWLRQVQ
jgi:RHS repeat-associated protein